MGKPAMKYIKYIFHMFVVLAAVVALPSLAQAQSFTAGGFNASRETTLSNTCRGEALTLNQRLIEVRQIINQIVTCNQNGQVFDSTANNCVTPTLSPDHQFTSADTGATLAFQNTNNNGFDVAAIVGGERGEDIECEPVEDPLTCRTPWGVIVDDGSSFRAYRTSSVPNGETCDSEMRQCVGGALTGSYTHRTCTIGDPPDEPPVDDPEACNLPWGGTIAHGGNVTAYENSSVASTATCNDESRVCNDGDLSGSFTHQSCTVREPVTTCRPWQWDFDGWCRKGPGGREISQCNNFNIFEMACRGNPNCTLRNVNYVISTCAVCNVEAERCITQ